MGGVLTGMKLLNLPDESFMKVFKKLQKEHTKFIEASNLNIKLLTYRFHEKEW
jgi:hypothetical protein